MKVIAIVGRLGSGKTALSYTILEEIKEKKQVYIFKHPNPDMTKKRGYLQIYEFGELENLQDCCVWMDEPQLFLRRQDKKSNIALERLMTLCRQRNITLILSTADTRFITRGLEYFISAYLILDINLFLVKRGSIISKIVKKNSLITTQEWRLPMGQYLFDSRKYYKMNGKKFYDCPRWYTEAWSKPFKIR